MGKCTVGPKDLSVDRPLDLREFYSRLHHCIGGVGPRGQAWDMELPDTSLDEDDFRIDYLWSEIASKFNPSGSAGQTARRDEALALFRESEEACRNANINLSSGTYRSQRIGNVPLLTLDAVIHTASVKIRSLLGRFRWDECDQLMGFGKGASYDIPRAKATAWFKFESKLDVSPSSVPLALAVLAGRPAWCRSLIRQRACVVPNAKNRLTTVPKNYKRDRVIAIEPLMNIYLQKGIGCVIRKRLNKVGINLNSQRANQLGALIGSLDGTLATVDLKAASDTVSIGIVEQLLPTDWYAALEQCRSLVGVLNSGERTLYRKFSSMGNGYTFELETLIFWGICSAVLDLMDAEDRRLLVYGDDIVCPSENVVAIINALQLCGFTTNRKKTHVDGPFRESCGKHYLNGFDVTPFYIKREVKTAADVFLLHNNLVRWSKRGFICDLEHRRSFDGKLPQLLEWIRSHLPSCGITICDGYGDSGFIGSFDEVCPVFRKWIPETRKGNKGRGHSCDHYALDHWPSLAVTKDVRTSGVIPLTLSLLDRRSPSGDDHDQELWSPDVWDPMLDGACPFTNELEDSPPLSRVVKRKRVRKTLRIPVREWNEIGQWI